MILVTISFIILFFAATSSALFRELSELIPCQHSTSQHGSLPFRGDWTQFLRPSYSGGSSYPGSSYGGSYYPQHHEYGYGMSRRYRRKAKGATEKLHRFATIVKDLDLEDCVARVVCGLSCQPDYYEDDGKQVLKTLVGVQSSGQMDKEDMRFYLNAGVVGRKAKFSESCNVCTTEYAKCPVSVSDLVDVLSLVSVDL